jgi:hypothetical protein
MRKITPNLLRLLVALAIVCSLVAITVGSASAQAYINVTPVGTYTGNGTQANPYTGTTSVIYGKTITISGGNLTTPQGTSVTVVWDGSPATTDPASVTVQDTDSPPDPTDNDQYIAASLKIPEDVAGLHYVTVTDGVTTSGQVWFNVSPMIYSVSPTQGPAGTTVTVKGYGFAALRSVDIYITGITPAVGTAVTSDKGTFTGTFVVPSGITAGAKTVTATDGAGNSATGTFTLLPSVSLIPTSGLAGTIVTARGVAFSPSQDVAIKFGANLVDLTSVTTGTQYMNGTYIVGVTTTSTGTFEVAFQVPTTETGGAKTVGVYAITATGHPPTVGATALTSTVFTVSPLVLSVSPASGKINDTVIITGGGFPANQSSGTITFGSTAATQGVTISTNDTGMLTASCKVPAVKAGATMVVVTVGSVSRTGSFTVLSPTLTLTPATGPIGTIVTVSGTNWNPNAPVTITMAGLTSSVSAYTDQNGSFSTSNLIIPSGAQAGANVVSCSDTIGNSAQATFTVPGAAITVSPTSGPSGTVLTVKGTGFPAYGTVTVFFAGNQMGTTPLTPIVGADGAFTCTFVVPASPLAVQIVAATASGRTASTTFQVIQVVDTKTALASISSQLVMVWNFDNATKGWHFYDPLDPASDITSLTPGAAYWIKVSADCTLTYGTNSWTLTTGWNGIGWR